jgi:hypothetical protein
MARGEGAIAFGGQLLDVPIVDRARQALTHNSQLTTHNRQPVESCESKIAQAKYISLVAFWIYGTIALERSIFLLPLPIISSDARLPSWHTYSNCSRSDSKVINIPVVHGAVYAPGSSMVIS